MPEPREPKVPPEPRCECHGWVGAHCDAWRRMGFFSRAWLWLRAWWIALRTPLPTYSATVECISSEGYDFEWIYKGVATRSDGGSSHTWVSEGDDETWESFELGMRLSVGEIADALNAGRAKAYRRVRSARLKASVRKAEAQGVTENG